MAKIRKDNLISHEHLLAALHYCPDTGTFTWKVGSRAGQPAGWNHGVHRYAYVGVGRKVYRASRLGYFYMTGAWPRQFVDHVNCDRTDNRWSNLRDASPSQNARNIGKRRDNKSGFKGVSFHNRAGRYRAEIRVKGRTRHLGLFNTPQEASKAYEAAAKSLAGEFARAAL